MAQFRSIVLENRRPQKYSHLFLFIAVCVSFLLILQRLRNN